MTEGSATTTTPTNSPIVTDGQPSVVVNPVVDTTPPPDNTQEPAANSADPAAAAPNANNGTTPEWYQKRINELTLRRQAAEREAKMNEDKLSAERAKNAELLQQLTSKPNDPAAINNAANTNPLSNSNQPQLSKEELEKLIQERAVQLAQANAFNDACNAIAETGKREFTDWDESLKNLSLAGAIGQDVPADFLETAVELKDPHKILHYLGKHVEEAEKIAKLPPKRMALEMARIEALIHKPAAAPPPTPISNAPAPVIPVNGSTKVASKDINDPSLTTAEFMALREEQEAARRTRYRRA